jgi:hypothetical protein
MNGKIKERKKGEVTITEYQAEADAAVVNSTTTCPLPHFFFLPFCQVIGDGISEEEDLLLTQTLWGLCMNFRVKGKRGRQ